MAGFREASPHVAELLDEVAGVAVFAGVEGVREGCPHDGILYLADGSSQPVVLRCLEEPRAPGGYSYHQLVLLRTSEQVEGLLEGPLALDGFVRLAPHDDHEPNAGEDDPGYVVSTHRSQLLFGDQTVRQQLEAGPLP